MGIEIYLPTKVKIKRIVPLKHYTGTLEMAGHTLQYSLKIDDPIEEGGTQMTRLHWENYRPVFSAIYRCINKDVLHFLNDKIIDCEAKINLMKKKFPGNLGIQLSGGTRAILKKDSKTEYSISMPRADIENVQMEYDTNLRLPSNLEQILRNTAP